MRTYILCFLCIICLLGQLSAQSSKKRTTELGLNVTTTLAGFFNSGGETAIDPYIISLKTGRKNRFFRMGATFNISNSRPLDFTTSIVTKEQDYNIRLGFERRIPITERFRMHWGIDGIVQYTFESTESRFSSSVPVILKSQSIGGGGGPVMGIAFVINERMYLSTEAAMYGIYTTGRVEAAGIDGVERQNPVSFTLSPMIPNSLYFNFSF